MSTTDTNSEPSQEQPQQSQKPARRRRRGLGCTLSFFALLAFLCYIGVLGGNVREVDPGRFYRSSQLTGRGYESLTARVAGRSLASVIAANHIKTLLNLRGGSWKDERYREEVEICKANGVDHIDDTFSARSLPPPEAMLKMLDVFDHAKYPILVHCQAGSDRTGLVSTAYANICMNEPLDTAEDRELTWRYGHFSFSNTWPMNEFFDLYRANSHGTPLRDWIIHDYASVYAQSPHGSRRNPPGK